MVHGDDVMLQLNDCFQDTVLLQGIEVMNMTEDTVKPPKIKDTSRDQPSSKEERTCRIILIYFHLIAIIIMTNFWITGLCGLAMIMTL